MYYSKRVLKYVLCIYIMFGFCFTNIDTSQNKWDHNTDIWDDNTLENIWYVGTLTEEQVSGKRERMKKVVK